MIRRKLGRCKRPLFAGTLTDCQRESLARKSWHHGERIMIKNPDVLRAAGKPTNYEELVIYLRANPLVRKEDEAFDRRFLHDDEHKHLHFTGTQTGPAGAEFHTPCGGPCGPGGFLPTLAFELDFFSITMFDVTTRWFYRRAA